MATSLNSPFSIFAEWWGDDITRTNIDFMISAPQEQWKQFSRYYMEHRSNELTDELPPGKVETYCSVFSRPDELYEPENIPLGSARVLALALYADRVYVRDPFEPLAIQFCVMDNAISTGEPPHEATLRECLQFLATLAPLAKADVLRFPFIHGSGRKGSRRDSDEIKALPVLLDRLMQLGGVESFDRDLAWRVVTNMTGVRVQLPGSARSFDDQLDWRWATDPRRVKGDASGILAGQNVLMNIASAGDTMPHGAVFIGTPLERSVLELAMRTAGLLFTKRAMRMSNLATLAVPVLIPSPEVVVSTRLSTAYLDFRDDLGNALRAVEEIPSTNEYWLTEARALMDSELAASRARLSREVRESRVLCALKGMAIGLSFSALGTLAGAEVGGGKVLPSVTSAAVATLGASAFAHIKQRREARRKRAVLESYLIFGSPLEKGNHT